MSLRKLNKVLLAALVTAASAGHCTLDTSAGIGPEASLLLSAASGNSQAPGVLNVINNGVLHSGFLLGSAGGSAFGISVSVNGKAYQPAIVTGNTWRFAMPTGSNSPRPGSAIALSIRATGSTGLTLSETQITIYQGLNRDINGDGYADLIVAGHLNSGTLGKVYLFQGRNPQITSKPAITADQTIAGSSAGEQYGRAVTTGDFNGDNYADLAVTAPEFSTKTGRVFIYHGTPAGLNLTPQVTIAGPATSSEFGFSLAAGDVNGDGYDDLVVGAPMASAAFGQAYIFHGAPAGIAASTAAGAQRIITGESALDEFGFQLTIGNVNGDSYADVAVSARGHSSSAGRAYIFHGSATGVAVTSAGFANTLLTGQATNDALGTGLKLRDLNLDGFADLISGAVGSTGNTGRIYIHHGGSTGIPTNGISTGAKAIISGETAGDKLGSSLSAGDLNGDGYPELAIASPINSASAGRIYIFSGAAAGFTSAGAGSATMIITGELAGIKLGQSLDFSDVNGDGFHDLLLGAFGHNANQGRAYVFSGGATGITQSNSLGADTTLQGESTGDLFGVIVH